MGDKKTMRIKDAFQSIPGLKRNKDVFPLYTPWGETLDKDDVLQEYPRPQMRRKGYQMLNGEWEYRIVSKTEETITPGEVFDKDGLILVPFSPESILSGVERQLLPSEYLWYQKEIDFEVDKSKEKCILHFGAVDQNAWVYINGREVFYHRGGFLPFEIDITDFLVEGKGFLQVKVEDLSDTSCETRGKQKLNRGGIFYTAQSGIWQSVWYEKVPQNYIRAYRITPNFDEAKVVIEMDFEKPFTSVSMNVKDAECIVSQLSESVFEVQFTDGQFVAWTPETPHLYEFVLEADDDLVEGYFAMRCFTLEPDEKGILRACLNHKPCFMHGVLDQGYWSDGLLTAPSDEALIFDIELAKKAGFNMMRKHIKIEPLRWYYHCDRLGMIVWQDMVNGGSNYHMPWISYFPTVFPKLANRIKDNHYWLQSRASEDGRKQWEIECMDTIKHLYNVPSIAVWVPFNEGWGQFDAARIAREIREVDSTRLIDHASGWFDQQESDFKSVHNYFRPLTVEVEENRAFAISEYGGFSCHVEHHSSIVQGFGYKKYDTCQELSDAVKKCFEEAVFPLVERGLAGAVYTQLSDVEEEVNGIVTYDRKVIKIKLD